MTHDLSIKAFRDFCASKPEGEAYDYCDNENCALAQFLAASGLTDVDVSGFGIWNGTDETGIRIGGQMDDAASCANDLDQTFSGLVSRLGAFAA